MGAVGAHALIYFLPNPEGEPPMSAIILTAGTSLLYTTRPAETAGCPPERAWLASGRYQAAIQDAERFEPEDPRLAGSLYRLAELYREVGEDTEAEPLLRQALEIQERALGPAHPQVALTLSSLMFLYRNQGNEPEAEAAAARVHGILVDHARHCPENRGVPRIAECRR